MKTMQVVGAVCVSMLLGWPALAKDKPIRTPKGEDLQMPKPIVVQARTVHAPEARPRQDWVNVKVAFSDNERTVLRQYVQHYDRPEGVKSNKKGRGLPPGLAKKAARGKELPPGWQKKCVVGEIMPVEVYEKCQPLPPDLVVKLPPPPPDTITITVGGKVVRLINATREILDVFDVDVRF